LLACNTATISLLHAANPDDVWLTSMGGVYQGLGVLSPAQMAVKIQCNASVRTPVTK